MPFIFKLFCSVVLVYLMMGITPSRGENDNLYLQRFSVNEGLSQASINDIYQDQDGFLWIATENGVNLYDGYRFRVLPGPDGRLENNGVYKTLQDSSGLFWLLASHGLYTYDKKTNEYVHVLAHAPGNENDFLADILVGNSQFVWIASSKTILRYEKSTRKIDIVIDLSDEMDDRTHINEIFLVEGVLYIATNQGAYVADTTSFHWKKLPSINEMLVGAEPATSKIYNIYVAPNKNVYLGTYKGLYLASEIEVTRYLKGKVAKINYRLIDESIDSWAFYPNKEYMYVGGHSGLSRLNLSTNSTERLLAFNDAFDDINNNVVSSVFIDQQGVFWLGSKVTGVYKWDPQLSLVKNLKYKKQAENRLSDNVVWAIEKDKSNESLLWIATEHGINLYDSGSGEVQRFLDEKAYKSAYNESNVTQLQQDNFDRLWLLSSVGVKLFDTSSRKLITPPFPDETLKLLSQEHYMIYVDRYNHMWSLTSDRFSRIDLTTGQIDELKELESFAPDEEIFNILGYWPNSKDMLLSTNKSLIAFNIESRKSKTLYTHDGVAKSDWAYIDSWLIDDNDVIWIAFSGKGLIGIDATTLEKKYFYNKKNAQIDNNIYGLMKDSDGDVWFSSHNGVYLLNNDNQHIRNFNLSDGLSAREFNANSFERVNDHLFIYGSINGVTMFDPIQLKQKHFQSKISVYSTNVEVLSRDIKTPFSIDSDRTIEIEYDDVGVRFEFSALTYQHENLTYNFKLDGIQQISYPDTSDNFIMFPSLPSGEHILSVRVRSPYTGEYSEATQLKIKVSYAPWASPLAYFLYCTIFLFSFLFWLERKRQLTKKLIDAHDQVKFREQRLSLALHGSNSSVWDWQSSNNMLFGTRASDELGFANLTESYSFDQHIGLIHDNDREAFVHQWQSFIEVADLNDNFACCYRLRTSDGDWLWYKDLGKIVAVDQQGNPTRITGSYTNVTQSRAEAERAQYYGEAFKQTKDWVLIITDNFSRVMVNNSLQEAFGWHASEFSFDASVFGLNAKRMAFYKKLFLSLDKGEHWRGEELITTKSGDEYHVLLNINVSMNTTTNSLHYVCIFTDITAQKLAEKELRYLANYDHLTDLPNRSLLLERIKHGMDYSTRISSSIALFFIDLDRFKQINDSLGHDYGDLLLQEISVRLKSVLRVDDTIARLGGDEFVILLESFRDNSQLGKIAYKIIESIAEPFDLKGNIVSVGASVGIALYPEDASNSDDLLKNADVAMYHAKQLGRGTFQFFTPRMNVEATQRLHAETQLKQAHEAGQFINYYQPIIDSQTGKAKGVELLLRWQSDNGVIMPNDFIPIAEDIGLIIPMTEKALERALTDLHGWLEHREEMFLSVNISAVHFAKENLVEYLTDTLKKFGIPPNLLKLEVTESTLIKEPTKVIAQMTALAKLGVSLALDDFGTGYSSLNYLKQLPLDVIKIDRSFISGIGQDSADEAIVGATLVLANSLCMHCIAEGVETQEQLTYLAEHKCFTIQGYIYSKPVDNLTIVQYLEQDTIELTV